MKRVIMPILLVTAALITSTPIVHAETELSLTATASSTYANYIQDYGPQKTVDNNLNNNNYWIGEGDYKVNFWWLQLDCGDVYNLGSISVYWYNNSIHDYGSSNYDIQISSDGETWTNLYTGLTTVGGTGSPYQATYSLSGNARYVRIYLHNVLRSFPVVNEVKIYAGESNQPPTASASANPTVGDIPLDVQFTGSGTDPDGTIVSYNWNFKDGATSTAQNPNHTYNNSGSYNVTLTVIDDDGATGSDSVAITVNESPNQAPTASASANPVLGEAPLDVQFTGSGTDSDGSIVSYDWDFDDGTASGVQSPLHTYQNPGSYTAVLTVADDDGATAADSVLITVEESVPVIPPTTKEIPHFIRFQGRLTDKGNIPLNGYYNITFRIYDAETEGNLLWEDLHDNLQVTNGVVNVLLGIDLPFDVEYWLSTEIGNDGEMSPRQPITSVGYSYTAEFAKKGGTVAYANHGEISASTSSKLSIHLEDTPSSVKLYIWGELASGGSYPNDVTVEIDDRDKTSSALSLANDNWSSSEGELGDGTSSHPLISGTGELDITNLATWSKGEHTLELKQSSSTKAKIRYNVYISY